jgi:ribonuclease D
MSPADTSAQPAQAGYRWVDSGEDLAQLADALRGSPSHALDTESNSGFVYRERLCLVQLNVAGELWLVDLLALPDDVGALDPIRESLESAEVRTIVHGGEFDVGCFKRDYRLALGGVWDTQQASSFLGWPRTGYGSVVEEICSVQLDKKFAHFDWGRRPIVQDALGYALDDVRYLPQVARRLEREIVAADLAEELAIANETVMGATWSGRQGTEAIWRIKGIRALSSAALQRLVALWEWRESVARHEDRPPGRVLNTQQMLAIARRGPRGERDLRSAGLRGRSLARGREMLRVLRQARQSPPKVPEPPRGTPPVPGEAGRLKRLREWRRAEAERRGVPQHVVLPPSAMQHLARHGADRLEDVPQFGAKRARLYGPRLRELTR